MRRHRNPNNLRRQPLRERLEKIDLMFDLLPKMAIALTATHPEEQRFRAAVLYRLAKIESIAVQVMGAQIAEAHMNRPGTDKKMTEHAVEAQKVIEEQAVRLTQHAAQFIDGTLGAKSASKKMQTTSLSSVVGFEALVGLNGDGI